MQIAVAFADEVALFACSEGGGAEAKFLVGPFGEVTDHLLVGLGQQLAQLDKIFVRGRQHRAWRAEATVTRGRRGRCMEADQGCRQLRNVFRVQLTTCREVIQPPGLVEAPHAYRPFNGGQCPDHRLQSTSAYG